MNTISPKELPRAFEALYKDKSAAALAFESKDSFEMAYLARWSVVETTVKLITHAEACQLLRLQLDEWSRFLDKPNRKSPNPIRHFPTDAAKSKLPTATELKKQFATALNLLELLDPAKKYRKKRNAIAHSAEAFAQASTYEEYKAKVQTATDELRKAL